MNPADAAAQEEGDGVKSYVPERGGSHPIPEIESRLDAFFNLDVSESSISSLESETSATPAAPAPQEAPLPADGGDEFDGGSLTMLSPLTSLTTMRRILNPDCLD